MSNPAALHFRSAAHVQNQRLADRLQEVVGGEQEEHVEHEQERGRRLPRAHVAEDPEGAVEKALRPLFFQRTAPAGNSRSAQTIPADHPSDERDSIVMASLMIPSRPGLDAK
jgi:hypothetical protein